MPIASGARLGPYEIVSALGSGGAPAAHASSERTEQRSMSERGWGPASGE
jgi:hypothetical protein